MIISCVTTDLFGLRWQIFLSTTFPTLLVPLNFVTLLKQKWALIFLYDLKKKNKLDLIFVQFLHFCESEIQYIFPFRFLRHRNLSVSFRYVGPEAYHPAEAHAFKIDANFSFPLIACLTQAVKGPGNNNSLLSTGRQVITSNSNTKRTELWDVVFIWVHTLDDCRLSRVCCYSNTQPLYGNCFYEKP